MRSAAQPENILGVLGWQRALVLSILNGIVLLISFSDSHYQCTEMQLISGSAVSAAVSFRTPGAVAQESAFPNMKSRLGCFEPILLKLLVTSIKHLGDCLLPLDGSSLL